MGYYKIKDLEQLSGIKAHTIRIWEKRYNVISPERTDTNIRLYTDDDLKNLLSIAILNKNGHKISKIVELDDNSRAELLEECTETDLPSEAVFDKLILSMIELDEEKFAGELDQLFQNIGVVQTFAEYLFPFIERIGIMWKVGSITPVQEHFITHIMRQKLIAKTDLLGIPPLDGKRVILFLPEHEYHELSLLLYNYILRSAGKYTYYLGQTVPIFDIINSINELKPDAIVCSFITSVTPEKVLSTFDELISKTDQEFKILAGGMQVENVKNQLPKQVKTINSVGILLDI